MTHSGTSDDGSDATSSLDDWLEMEAELATVFTPHMSYHSYTTSQIGLSAGSPIPVEMPRPAHASHSSSFPPGAQSSNYPPTSYMWDDAFSRPMDPQPTPSFPIPDELSVYMFGHNFVSNNTTIPTYEQHYGTQHNISESAATISAPIYEQADRAPADSQPEHIRLWNLLCRRAIIINGPRAFVPQTIYQPYFQGDRERYVLLAQLHPPVVFCAQNSPEWGVPIPDILSHSVRLVDGDEPAFVSCGPSIGIRVQWPGYRSFHKQVPTKDYTAERRIINKARLAKIVARCVKQFMDAMSQEEMGVGADPEWRVGPFDIRVDDIILVSLHHVSQGSWQPQLRLRGIRN